MCHFSPITFVFHCEVLIHYVVCRLFSVCIFRISCLLFPVASIKSYMSIVFIYFFILVQKNVKYVEEFR